MDFTTKELAVLNQMISIALLSGKIESSEEVKSVHQKVTSEILQRESKRQPISSEHLFSTSTTKRREKQMKERR